MKILDIIKRSGRNLRQAKGRTILTSLAIAIGAFAIMSSLALGNGMKEYINDLLGANINPRQIRITAEETKFSFGSGGQLKEYSEGYNTKYSTKTMSNKDFDKLSKLKEIDDIDVINRLSPKYFIIEGNNKKWMSNISAFDPLIKTEAKFGKLPAKNQTLKENEIIIPEDYLKTLKLKPKDVIGKKMTFVFPIIPNQDHINKLMLLSDNESKNQLERIKKGFGLEKKYQFKIVAVTKNMPLSFNTSSLMINQQKYRYLNDELTKGTPMYQRYFAFVGIIKKGQKPEDVKKILNKKGYHVDTAKDAQKTLFQFVGIIQIIVTAFGAMSLLVSVFGIINTMYISVLERINQIGLMKALGMRNQNVAQIFRYEAAWIGFIGGFVGAGASWIVGILINPWLAEKVGFEKNTNVLLQYDLVQFIILIVVLVLIAILSGYFPARKAAKLDPIEALRTE